MSARQWLAKNDTKEKAYYYWLQKFRKEANDQMQLPAVPAKTEIAFAEVTMPFPVSDGSSAAVIKYNRLTMELSNNISEVLLSYLLKEVLHA